jgi:hypothetical protein
MNPHLSALIAEYVAAVDRALSLLEKSGVSLPSSQVDWVANGPDTCYLDGALFRKHGVGCRVEFPTGAVDFDFGVNGEMPTLDVWRLIEFAGDRLLHFGFASEEEVVAAFRSAVATGDLVSTGYANLHLLRDNAV